MVKPHGRLVLVSLTGYPAYTPSLSPGHLPGAFSPTRRSEGTPYLRAGFALICFQRLSFPNIATQRCSWRNNWHTRGSSVPVLSYWGQIPSSVLRPRQIGTELSRDVLNPAHVPL